MTDIDRLMQGLDIEKPRWYIEFADQDELKIFVLEIANKLTFEDAHRRLRASVAYRLGSVVRGAIQAGLVTYIPNKEEI